MIRRSGVLNCVFVIGKVSCELYCTVYVSRVPRSCRFCRSWLVARRVRASLRSGCSVWLSTPLRRAIDLVYAKAPCNVNT